MNKYVIFHEFGRRRLTSEQNYSALIRNASQIIDVSNFASDESVKQYLINEWKLFEHQIIIADDLDK